MISRRYRQTSRNVFLREAALLSLEQNRKKRNDASDSNPTFVLMIPELSNPSAHDGICDSQRAKGTAERATDVQGAGPVLLFAGC
ncbi:MAG: hypothetical protein ACO1PZ_08220 [Gammaproteobacteria bacterium]